MIAITHPKVTVKRTLVDAAYSEDDFPALRLARGARFVRRLGRVLLAILGLTVAAMLFAPWQQSIRGEGTVVAFDPFERPQSVEAPVKGIIFERGEGVQENAYVTKGQLLFKIQDQDPLKLTRLEMQRDNAKNELEKAEMRLQQADLYLKDMERIVHANSDQLTNMNAALKMLMLANDRFVLQAANKVNAETGKLQAAEAKLVQVDADWKRRTDLFKEGLESEFSQQKSEQEYRDAKAKVEIAKQELENAKNGLEGKKNEQESYRSEWQAKINKVQSELDKARADVNDARIKINKNNEEIAQKKSKLLDAESKLTAQKTQDVYAPRDGHIMDLAVVDSSSIVKPGDQLCRIVPRTENPAVQIKVAGMDVPLIEPGRHVRMQFEGWPAVQFSGWPSVAVGTFGGEVAIVDAMDDGTGKFRVVIKPDPNDIPWPEYPYLRQGARANGWVLLDQVPLGYEVWRRMNGFPQSLQTKDATDGKEKSKAPKVKI